MYRNSKLSLVLFVLVLVPLVSNLQAQTAPAPGGTAVTSARIFYSGRMMGYLREDRGNRLSDPADHFLSEYDRQCNQPGTARNCVLLGMGDNFAPNYAARMDDLGHFKGRNSNTSWKDDNVARFLVTANFTALVPFKEDFYFGAYRLWTIADSINRGHAPSGRAGPFLADNLVLRPTDEVHRESWLDPTNHKPGKHVKKFTDHVDWVTSSFAGSAMPWLAKLTFTFSLPAPLAYEQARGLQGSLCQARENPDDIDPTSNCSPWTAVPKTEKDGTVKEVSFTKNPTSVVNPGGDYGFCIAHPQQAPAGKQASKELQYCLPIHVETPMFSTPYVLSKDPASGTPVAIFAVVDPQLRLYMPKQNAGWDVMNSSNNVLTKSEKMNHGADWLPHHIEIATLAPNDGLNQAIDAFELDHPDFHGITVLMAQMAYDAADELARDMKSPDPAQPGPAFDLVVARAETSHQTRPQTTILLPPVSQGRPRFVVGPPPAYTDDTQVVQLPLGWAQISRAAGSASGTFSVESFLL